MTHNIYGSATIYTCNVCLEDHFSLETQPELTQKIEYLTKKIFFLNEKKTSLMNGNRVFSAKFNRKSYKKRIQSILSKLNTFEGQLNQAFFSKKTFYVIGHSYEEGSHTMCESCFESYKKINDICYLCKIPFKKDPSESNDKIQVRKFIVMATGALKEKELLYPLAPQIPAQENPQNTLLENVLAFLNTLVIVLHEITELQLRIHHGGEGPFENL